MNFNLLLQLVPLPMNSKRSSRFFGRLPRDIVGQGIVLYIAKN